MREFDLAILCGRRSRERRWVLDPATWQSSCGNGTALFEVSTRGGGGGLSRFNLALVAK